MNSPSFASTFYTPRSIVDSPVTTTQQQAAPSNSLKQPVQNRISAELPPLKKTKKTLSEESVEAISLSDETQFNATLNIQPFTLKNMSMKYVNDMKWDLHFGGVQWTFYVHVLPEYGNQNPSYMAMVGLKVKHLKDAPYPPSPVNSIKAISRMPSATSSILELDDSDGEGEDEERENEEEEEQAAEEASSGKTAPAGSPLPSGLLVDPEAAAQSAKSSFSSQNSSGSGSGAMASGAQMSHFEVSWKIQSIGDNSELASSAPSLHIIEPGDDYVAEFTNDEFSFASCLKEGLKLEVLISYKSDENESTEKKSGEELEEEDSFYLNVEEQEQSLELRRRNRNSQVLA